VGSSCFYGGPSTIVHLLDLWSFGLSNGWSWEYRLLYERFAALSLITMSCTPGETTSHYVQADCVTTNDPFSFLFSTETCRVESPLSGMAHESSWIPNSDGRSIKVLSKAPSVTTTTH
jgi:hypothetical protein